MLVLRWDQGRRSSPAFRLRRARRPRRGRTRNERQARLHEAHLEAPRAYYEGRSPRASYRAIRARGRTRGARRSLCNVAQAAAEPPLLLRLFATELHGAAKASSATHPVFAVAAGWCLPSPIQPLGSLVQIVLGVVEPVALLVVSIDARKVVVLGQDGCFRSSRCSTSSLAGSLLTGCWAGGPRKRSRAPCRSPRDVVIAAG